jgi:hypothetical protein
MAKTFLRLSAGQWSGTRCASIADRMREFDASFHAEIAQEIKTPISCQAPQKAK